MSRGAVFEWATLGAVIGYCILVVGPILTAARRDGIQLSLTTLMVSVGLAAVMGLTSGLVAIAVVGARNIPNATVGVYVGLGTVAVFLGLVRGIETNLGGKPHPERRVRPTPPPPKPRRAQPWRQASWWTTDRLIVVISLGGMLISLLALVLGR